jgi:hypothetical protein
MILYHHGIDDSSYHFDATVAAEYRALAIETCNNVS